jgi:hypothetical protein
MADKWRECCHWWFLSLWDGAALLRDKVSTVLYGPNIGLRALRLHGDKIGDDLAR